MKVGGSREITCDYVGIEATWTLSRRLRLDQFCRTEQLKQMDSALVRLTVSLVSNLYAKIAQTLVLSFRKIFSHKDSKRKERSAKKANVNLRFNLCT